MSVDVALFWMLFCHLLSAVISVVWIVRVEAQLRLAEYARDRNAGEIRRLERVLLGAQNKEFLLKTELKASQRNDGRDPITGRFTGAKE